MADVDINLDSSDLPLIIEALEMKRASLAAAIEAGDDASRLTALQQIDLLLNTFVSIQAMDVRS